MLRRDPDATIGTHFMLVRMAGLLRGLEVRPERMRANLDHGGGLVFSGEVLLKLVEAGMRREDAYRIVQSCAMTAVREGGASISTSSSLTSIS